VWISENVKGGELMKKYASVFVAIVGVSPGLTYSESPSWSFIEVSYLNSEADGDVFVGEGLDLDGLEIAGSIGIGDWFFFDMKYSEEVEDFNILGFDVDLDLDRFSAGVGAAWGLTDNTDLYGHLAYEKWTVNIGAFRESDDEDESGYSYAIGIRSVFWDAFELRGEIGQVDLGDTVDETQYMVGAYYTFARHFTLGASYTDLSDIETIRATFRYQM
jgi:hypothetical protein